MSAHRPFRSRVAARIAGFAALRGDAPVVVVPGEVDDLDMRDIVYDLAVAMGYNAVVMLTPGFTPDCGFFRQPRPSTLAASERGRLHVLDERLQPHHDAGNDDFRTASIIRHLDSGGGIAAPVVVIARCGEDAVAAHAVALRKALGRTGREVVAVI